jgi:hypothetical protein
MAKALLLSTHQSFVRCHASQQPAAGELSCVNPNDFTRLHAAHHHVDLVTVFAV